MLSEALLGALLRPSPYAFAARLSLAAVPFKTQFSDGLLD